MRKTHVKTIFLAGLAPLPLSSSLGLDFSAWTCIKSDVRHKVNEAQTEQSTIGGTSARCWGYGLGFWILDFGFCELTRTRQRHQVPCQTFLERDHPVTERHSSQVVHPPSLPALRTTVPSLDDMMVTDINRRVCFALHPRDTALQRVLTQRSASTVQGSNRFILTSIACSSTPESASSSDMPSAAIRFGAALPPPPAPAPPPPPGGTAPPCSKNWSIAFSRFPLALRPRRNAAASQKHPIDDIGCTTSCECDLFLHIPLCTILPSIAHEQESMEHCKDLSRKKAASVVLAPVTATN